MDVPIIVAIISGAAAIVVPAVSFYLTKSKERQADWQRYKFELYKELVQSLSGIVGTDSTPQGNRRFASACNTLHLIGSKGVLDALDLRMPNNPPCNQFKARLWGSGSGTANSTTMQIVTGSETTTEGL